MIRSRIPLILLTAFVLSGCSIAGLASGVFAPAQSSTADQSSASGTAAVAAASLPFRTVLNDSVAMSRYQFQAGSSETAVLHSQAELNAFLSRHPRIAVPGYGGKTISPPALPSDLTKLDFSKYVAIAAYDGDVRKGATTRIVAVQNQGDGLQASVTRWEPPDSANLGQDTCGRMHIIALARTDRTISFAPETVLRQAASSNDGGVGIGGSNFIMHPRWPAVPNPEITKDRIEAIARNGNASATVDVELRTLTWIQQNVSTQMGKANNFTPDSQVWFAKVTGPNLRAFGPGPMSIGAQIGGGPPPIGEVDMILSPEDGGVMEAASKPVPGTSYNPGFRFQPNDPFYLGDSLTFMVTGQAPDGTLTLTFTPPSGAPIVKEVAFKDLGSFSLPLDPAHVPGLADVPLQTLKLDMTYQVGTDQKADEVRTIQLVKDRDVQKTPPLRAASPSTSANPSSTSSPSPPGGDPNDWTPSATDAALEPVARDIAATDWKGQNLTITHRVVTKAEVPVTPNMEIPDGVVLEEFDVKGTFPKYLLPAVVSSTGADAVMQPTELKIVLSQTQMIHVVSQKAYAQ